jgi:hypothetical protein
MLEELQKTEEQIAEFPAAYKTSDAQTVFHNGTAGFEIFIRDFYLRL